MLLKAVITGVKSTIQSFWDIALPYARTRTGDDCSSRQLQVAQADHAMIISFNCKQTIQQ